MKHTIKSTVLMGSSLFVVGMVAPFVLTGSASATEAYTKKNNQHQQYYRSSEHEKDKKQDDKKTYKKSNERKGSEEHKKTPHQKPAEHKQDHKRTQNIYLQRKLNTLLKEHAVVGVAALKAASKKAPNAGALKQKVDANSVAIARTVDKLYPGTKHKFLYLWRQHIHYYEQYFMAAKHHDKEGMKDAKHNLAAFAWQVSHLLNKANRSLDQDQLKGQISHHGEQVTQIIDYLVAGKDEAAKKLAEHAVMHMTQMARTMTDIRYRD